MSSNVPLNDNGIIFEEFKVFPADEPPDVPLDGDGSPGLCAVPLLFQLLVQ